MNHEPTREPRQHRLSDEELVNKEIERAVREGRPLNDAGARVAASMLHYGMSSPLYALASSGALVDRLSDELDRELTLATDDGAHEIIAWVEQLHRYVASRDNAEPIDGWADLWLEQPEQVDTGLDDEDCCTYCKTHFSEPHDPTCPRSHEDFADEEEPAAEDAEPSLEDQIQAKLGHISTENLIRRMERAEDFGYDDEAVELSRRLREQGKTWKWSDHFFRPQVIIYDAGESPT